VLKRQQVPQWTTGGVRQHERVGAWRKILSYR
jgi:hypothetical protein